MVLGCAVVAVVLFRVVLRYDRRDVGRCTAERVVARVDEGVSVMVLDSVVVFFVVVDVVEDTVVTVTVSGGVWTCSFRT